MFAVSASIGQYARYGDTDDGLSVLEAGRASAWRLVARDGYICVETFEMSSTVASVEGECARCLRPEEEAAARRAQALNPESPPPGPVLP